MMKQRDYETIQRYNNDPTFHSIVSALGKWMIDFKISPNELHDAVNLAGDITSSKRYTPPYLKTEKVINQISYKSLVYGFLNLSYIKQCEIISMLSLGREEDKGLKHVQIIDKFIKRAEEQKCIDEFWKEVQRRQNDG